MSELISFNTEELAKPTASKVIAPPVFNLVSEDNFILRQVMPKFDFVNPPVNPNEFASKLVETCKTNKGYGL